MCVWVCGWVRACVCVYTLLLLSIFCVFEWFLTPCFVELLMFLCKWRARKQISLHRDNKVVLYCISSGVQLHLPPLDLAWNPVMTHTGVCGTMVLVLFLFNVLRWKGLWMGPWTYIPWTASFAPRLGSIPLQLSFLFKKVEVCGHCLVTLSITSFWNIKMALIAAHLNAEVILVVTV